MNIANSSQLFAEAQGYIPGGVNSPVRSFRAPASVPGVDWSDHLSFRRLGMPGVLVTDTAFQRNTTYHTAADRPDLLDYARMADLVRALHGVVARGDE